MKLERTVKQNIKVAELESYCPQCPWNGFSCPPAAVSSLLPPALFARPYQFLAVSSLEGCNFLFAGAFVQMLIGRDAPPMAPFLLTETTTFLTSLLQ